MLALRVRPGPFAHEERVPRAGPAEAHQVRPRPVVVASSLTPSTGAQHAPPQTVQRGCNPVSARLPAAGHTEVEEWLVRADGEHEGLPALFEHHPQDPIGRRSLPAYAGAIGLWTAAASALILIAYGPFSPTYLPPCFVSPGFTGFRGRALVSGARATRPGWGGAAESPCDARRRGWSCISSPRDAPPRAAGAVPPPPRYAAWRRSRRD